MAVTDIIEPGALSGIKPGEEIKRRTFTVPLYEYQAQTPDLNGKSLSDVYGSAAMPMFQWVKRIQTGEKTFDIQDDMDTKMQKDYDRLVKDKGQPKGLMSPNEILSATTGQIGANIGSPIGSAFGQALFTDGVGASDAIKSLVPFNLAGKGALDYAPGVFFDPNTGKEIVGITNELSGDFFNPETGMAVAKGTEGSVTSNVGKNIFASKAGDSVPSDFYSGDALKASAGGAVGNFAVQLAMGEDPASAARKAGVSAVTGHFAKSLLIPILGPVGGVIGGLVGGAIGGRVICNELMKQGLMSKEEVILDYRFTRDYLTPQHVNGYHLWAVWVVKQMRKGRMIGLWKHLSKHRANEIAYIYGKKNTPDYLGKVYRTIGEPVCWFLGLFCQKTDWSTLYKNKEI
jgi:hypothetical protein|tara:strand:+ start:2073 stop:3275 length:1203 start_codon:yes stop_codon:yes gene_type:complete